MYLRWLKRELWGEGSRSGLLESFFSLAPWESRPGASAAWLNPVLSPEFLHQDRGWWWQTRRRAVSDTSFRTLTFDSCIVNESLRDRERRAKYGDSYLHNAQRRPIVHSQVVVLYSPLRLPRSRSVGWDGVIIPSTSAAVERAYQILKCYLPKVEVTCPPAGDPIVVNKETDTRKSPTPGLDGRNKVNQLAADRLPGRPRVPGKACVQIVDPLIWPTKEEDHGCSNFCFACPHGSNMNHWAISPYWCDGLDYKVDAVAAHIVYSAMHIRPLSICENFGCLMNNSDGVEESESADSSFCFAQPVSGSCSLSAPSTTDLRCDARPSSTDTG